MSKPCGCYVSQPNQLIEATVKHCPLHAAAGTMYRSLQQIIEFAENEDATGLRAKERLLIDIVLEAEQALEAAGYQKPADDSEMPLGPIKVYGEKRTGKTEGGFTS